MCHCQLFEIRKMATIQVQTCIKMIPLEYFPLLPHPGAVRVTVRESGVEVVQGDSVTLPCSFFTMMPLFRLSIIWTLTPLSDPDSPIQVSLLIYLSIYQ